MSEATAARELAWRFFRAGGVDQVRLDRGRDIASLPALDQKLWVALACPTRGIEFDERTLDLIDADGDGRIRAPEMLAAVEWTLRLLRSADTLVDGKPSLALAAIADGNDEGRAVLASARVILRMLGRPEATEISVQDTLDSEHIFGGSDFNGDGIVPPEAAGDEATRAVMEEIIACEGAATDRSGRPGVTKEAADRFFAGATAYAGWLDEAGPATQPLGADTAAAAALVRSIAAKLDDYFTRCRLAAFDPHAVETLNPPPEAYARMMGEALAPAQAEIAALPLARIEAPARLPLDAGLNPAWEPAIARLRAGVVVPLLGERHALAEGDWALIRERFAAYDGWLARKPETAIEQLGEARIRAIAASDLAAGVQALIDRDLALAPEMAAIASVEKLARFNRDLAVLLNNFVAFGDFYTRRAKAAFQAGTLYLDGRSFDLCLKIEDEAKHAPLASLGRVYLAYCRCTRKGEAAALTIAAAVTAGDSDNLLVGRNGVFYDRKGRDWDATIIRIVEHPISIRQAFWLPYKQAARLISEQVQKFAAARAAGSQSQLTQVVARIGGAAPPAPVAPPAPAFDAARFAGIFAAIGLAVGMLGTAIASIVTGMLQLRWWQMLLALAAIALIISGPSVLIAVIKLRSRNLGPILDAGGWAVNARLKISIAFGTALTQRAALPPGAERALADPYADKRTPWGLYVAAAIIVAVAAMLAWKLMRGV